MNPDKSGSAALAALLTALHQQIHIQSGDPKTAGDPYLPFADQMLASVGFIAYIARLGNWLLAVTNSLLLLPAVVGRSVMGRRRHNDGLGSRRFPAGRTRVLACTTGARA